MSVMFQKLLFSMIFLSKLSMLVYIMLLILDGNSEKGMHA